MARSRTAAASTSKRSPVNPVITKEEESSAKQWAHSVRAALDAAVHESATVQSVLSDIPLSYRQISRYFVSIFGLSPKQYQLEAKLEAAREYMISTTQDMTKVAMAFGFSSLQHFSACFKTRFGISPLVFRQKKRSEDTQGADPGPQRRQSGQATKLEPPRKSQCG